MQIHLKRGEKIYANPRNLTAGSLKLLDPAECAPRKLRLYETKASLLEKKGDAAGKKRVVAEELAWARKLPAAQFAPERLQALEKRLASAK